MPFRWETNGSLGGGFGDEEAAETVVHELDADEAFAGFGVANVDNAALSGEVIFLLFAASAGLRKWDGDVEVHADGYVETRLEGSAATAEIFAGGDFLEGDTCGVAAADSDGEAHGDAALGAWPCGGQCSAGADFLNHLEALTFLLPRVFGKYDS